VFSKMLQCKRIFADEECMERFLSVKM